MKYILNPQYVLRHEGNKSLILMRPNSVEAPMIHIIHPIYAMMLSFFNGNTLDESIERMAETFKISKELLKKKISPLINNSERISSKSGIFPPRTIVEFNDDIKKHTYNIEQFLYSDVHLTLDRLKVPTDIICNVTMKCATDCFYCYADRSNNFHKELPFEVLNKIIDDAKSIGVISFKLIGGDVFLYKEWYKLLEKLHDYDYSPCISTKVPLQEKHIKAIKEFKTDRVPIQISLDTLIEEHLYGVLNTQSPYIKKIKETFYLLEKFGVNYMVNTVLTKKNDSLEDIKSIEHFFEDKLFLQEWNINCAKCSMYQNKSYSEYKPLKENIDQITAYLNTQIKSNYYNYKVNIPKILIDRNKISKDRKVAIFKERIPCSGNLSSLYILPDGKVTICEELYWHPNFILGDLNNETITQVWNSQKAKDLFYLDQNAIRKESHCSQCNEFTNCRSYLHVCWRDVVLAYGKENWDYPDAFCPYSPRIERDIAM